MDKSILIVGNGGSISNSNLGLKIDRFDEVIRINDAITVGYENDVGSKRTIWSTYNPEKKFDKYIRHFGVRNLSMNQLKDSIDDVREVWYVSPVVEYLKSWNYINLGMKKKIKRHESFHTLNEIEKLQHHPSTGFILIYLLLLIYDKIYIVGFDFNGRTQGIDKTHYFADWKQDKSKEYPHNLDRELLWVNDKIQENRIVPLDEIIEIKKSKFIGITRKNLCSNCGKESELYSWESDICHYCESNL